MADLRWFRPIAGTALMATGLLLVLGPDAGTAQVTPVSKGQALAAQCAQCHGTDGRSVADIDSLAGEDDLTGEMLEMKYGTDLGMMELQAHGYTDAEIQAIAAYFASISERASSTSATQEVQP